MAKLILTRHGQSLWNAQNKFTGWVDVPLSERGRAEATIASCKLREKNYQIDVCFTSLYQFQKVLLQIFLGVSFHCVSVSIICSQPK